MAITPIDKINSTLSATKVQNAPSQDKNLESQIAAKQQHLKRVASDEDMTASEKEQKRREIQKEIDELNRKLREEEARRKEDAKKQEQEEALKKEELQEKINPTKPTKTEAAIESSKEKEKHIDMSVKDIQEMLSAEYFVQKERIQEHVDMEIQSTIQVLKSEISQDKLYGADTSKKEAELKALQEKENFWTEASAEVKTKQQQDTNQQNSQIQTTVNTNAKIVIDQI